MAAKLTSAFNRADDPRLQPAYTVAEADQLRLIAELTSRLSGKVENKSRSLLELEGLGQEVWLGVDVDEYLRRERTSWNG